MEDQKGTVELTEAELDELEKAFDALPAEKQERIMMVRELKRKGLTTIAMARLMKVSSTTLYNDLQWIKQNLGKFVDRFCQSEDVGAAVSLYQEIEDKAMDLASLISVEYEVEIDVLGKRTKVLKEPDHFGARSYMELAAKMRKERITLMQQVGMMKMIPQKQEQTGESVDVSKLKGPELERVRSEIRSKVIDIEDRIARIRAGGRVKVTDT